MKNAAFSFRRFYIVFTAPLTAGDRCRGLRGVAYEIWHCIGINYCNLTPAIIQN